MHLENPKNALKRVKIPIFGMFAPLEIKIVLSWACIHQGLNGTETGLSDGTYDRHANMLHFIFSKEPCTRKHVVMVGF